MEIGALFEVDNQADQVVKDVLESYLVYIVPWRRSAYDFNGLRAKLQEVHDQLKSGHRRYRGTPEPLKEAVMVGIDKALKAADVQRLKEAEVAVLDVPFRGIFQRPPVQQPKPREEQVVPVEPRHDI